MSSLYLGIDEGMERRAERMKNDQNGATKSASYLPCPVVLFRKRSEGKAYVSDSFGSYAGAAAH